MTWHTGRLIDHVHLRAADMAASRRFYDAALGVLGLRVVQEGQGWFAADELFVSGAEPGAAPTHIHLAFQARDRSVVDAFHAATVAAGGRDNGAPGERPYHPGYYAAFVLDPDGNNIEAVHHGPSRRSAASVEIEIAD
ncbi:VOC family protein [Arsenicitalea aurantiaca]|uniref:VOC family protein n=1 Tax=Arsenicitalea aurantiaca TaxID=1783274 RepID=A0A433XJY5_9HYPH|nr:VOC family protein [Arsenicitalea aurantiaca]RUT34390.1 VOC family protein [Arsenicitalea aurantiaca]